MKAGLLMGLESPSSRAERLARLVQIWGRVPPLEETVAKIDAVTTGDVREFAEHMAAHGPAALALYGPVDGAPDAGALAGAAGRLMLLAAAQAPDRDRAADAAPAGAFGFPRLDGAAPRKRATS